MSQHVGFRFPCKLGVRTAMRCVGYEPQGASNPAAQDYSAIIPPSTGIEAPVMYDAFAEATKAIT
jgi:hypothetical protein